MRNGGGTFSDRTARCGTARCRTARCRTARGFTLLEVLVAFVVLALTLGVLLHIFSLAMRTTLTAETYQQALLLAESKLAELTAGKTLEAGQDRGHFDDRFSWSAQIEPYERPEELEDIEFPVEPYLIRVDVNWGESDASQVNLTSLRLVSETTLQVQQSSSRVGGAQ